MNDKIISLRLNCLKLAVDAYVAREAIEIEKITQLGEDFFNHVMLEPDVIKTKSAIIR